MKGIRNISKRYYLRQIAACFLISCLFFNTSVLLAIEPGSLTGSTGLIGATWGDNTVINTDNGAILDWSNFNTTDGQSVTFNQYLSGILDSSSAVLNRISSGEVPTYFDGALTANGRVFIVNPAGIVFGDNASVNVAQLVASSLSISPGDFISGNYEFTGGAGSVINNGTILADSVALIGTKVLNTGTITCPGGLVIMAAGDSVLLGEPGSNIIVQIDAVTAGDTTGLNLGEADGDVVNTQTGTINAAGGKVVLAAGDVLVEAVEGIDRLSAHIGGGGGRVGQLGKINASATGTSGDGGIVVAAATQEVVLGDGSLTKANAADNGNGGQVLVNSLTKTTVDDTAVIEAKGGATSGDGGDIEIRGYTLSFAGNVDATAANGEGGDVTINAAYLTVADGFIPINPLENTVYEKWIEEQSQAGTDVELVAHSGFIGNITVEPISDGAITGGSGDIAMRTVYDTGGITFLPETEGGPITTTLCTIGGGNIYMLAGSGGITTGDMATTVLSNDKISDPGKIRLFTNNGGDISTGALTVTGGSYDEISAIASTDEENPGNLTINGEVSVLTNQVPSETKEIGQAILCLLAGGDVLIDGEVVVNAHGKYESTADIRVCAGGDATVNGPLTAEAKTSESDTVYTANASVLVHAGWNKEGPGTITTGPIKAKASLSGTGGPLELTTPGEESENGKTVRIEIDNDAPEPCPDCPRPPDLPPPISPIAKPDTGTTHMGTEVSGNVLDNDTPPEPGVIIQAILVTEPEHGTVTLEEDGTYTYQPDAGFVGTDSFTYFAQNGEATEPTVVTITITNQLPVANPGSDTDHMNNTINGNVSYADTPDDSYPDDPLTLGLVSDTSNGTLTLNPDGSYSYQPDTGFVGDDSFTYSVTDGQLDEYGNPVVSTATVTLTVTNQLPVANDGSASGHMNNIINSSVSYADTPDDSFPDDPLTLNLVSDTSNGTLTLNPDGSYSYQPDTGFVGDDSFTYSVTDGQLDEYGNPIVDTGTILLSIGNNLPIPVDDTATTPQNVSVIIPVLSNDGDPDGDPFSLFSYTDPTNGTLIQNPDGTFTYIPNPDYTGDDSFTYGIVDGQIGEEPYVFATVSITVTEVPVTLMPPPVPVIRVPEAEGCPAIIDAAANEIGVPRQTIQISIAQAMAGNVGVQPCETCSNLITSAATMNANLPIIEELFVEMGADANTPVSDVLLAQIATMITDRKETDTRYAKIDDFINALDQYVKIIENEVVIPTIEDPLAFAMEKHGSVNLNITAYIETRLVDLGG